MCGKSYMRFGSYAGRTAVLAGLFFVVGSLCWAGSWSNPLYPGKKTAGPVSAVISAPVAATTEATAQQPSDTSLTEAVETPTVAEPQQTVSETPLAKKIEAGDRTVKLSQADAKETYQVLVDQAESIGALAATLEERNATIAKQDRELNRWHLGLGFGAQANMDMDFGAAAYMTARKGSFLALGGVGYIPLDANWDTNRLNYQLGIVYEF